MTTIYPGAYNVIDADGHVLEPIDLWDHYIDPQFWDRRPQPTPGRLRRLSKCFH